MKKAYLILADGDVYEGRSIGAEGETLGEVVFTTGMTGYIETLTDPSYYGQIVIQTFPLIGNYGITPDMESGKAWPDGYIVRELSRMPSNFRCEGTIQDFLKEQDIPGIGEVRAQAIADYREESGGFKSIEDIQEVPGIKGKTFEKIADYITVE